MALPETKAKSTANMDETEVKSHDLYPLQLFQNYRLVRENWQLECRKHVRQASVELANFIMNAFKLRIQSRLANYYQSLPTPSDPVSLIESFHADFFPSAHMRKLTIDPYATWMNKAAKDEEQNVSPVRSKHRFSPQMDPEFFQPLLDELGIQTTKELEKLIREYSRLNKNSVRSCDVNCIMDVKWIGGQTILMSKVSSSSWAASHCIECRMWLADHEATRLVENNSVSVRGAPQKTKWFGLW